MCFGNIKELPQVIRGESSFNISVNPIDAFVATFTHISGYVIMITVIMIGVYIYKYQISTRMKQETGTKDEQRRFTYADNDSYGSSRLKTAEEMTDIIDLIEIKDTKGIILGKPLGEDTSNITMETSPTEKGKTKVISLPSPDEYNDKVKRLNWSLDQRINNQTNQHIAVFGASGSMKSRALARNMILQATRREESVVVTDPKGELYEESYQYLKDAGYDVKMFNLINQDNSDSWNCLAELFNDNGEVNPTNAKIFADTIVVNAKPDGSKDSYWNDNAANLLKATCLLVAEDDTMETSMGTVYDLIANKTLDEIDSLFRVLPEESVARRSYNLFASCNDVVKGQIINGLGIMLGVFQDEAVRNITTSSEIDLSKPITEKCAYFIVTSDQHRVFDFLAALMYSMLFIKLVERYDRSEIDLSKPITEKCAYFIVTSDQHRVFDFLAALMYSMLFIKLVERYDRLKYDKNIKLKHVHLILDEFPNIGQIPDFSRKISTVRSRGIDITIIFQNIVQLQNRYPNGQWEEILGNCDTTIFLGCKDETTAKYIANATGVASIEVTTQNTKYDRSQVMLNQNTTYNEVRSTGQRMVLNPDEVLSLKNTEELVFIRGQSAMKAKKFDYSLHPDAIKLKAVPIAEHIPQWKQDKIKAENERQERIAKRKLEIEQKFQREQEEQEKKQREEKENMDALFNTLLSSPIDTNNGGVEIQINAA